MFASSPENKNYPNTYELVDMHSVLYQRAWRARNADRIEEYNRRRREEYRLNRGNLLRLCASPDCNRPFEANRVDQRTCSRKCRSRVGQIRRSSHA